MPVSVLALSAATKDNRKESRTDPDEICVFRPVLSLLVCGGRKKLDWRTYTKTSRCKVDENRYPNPHKDLTIQT